MNHLVGIYGLMGSGKTTIATYLSSCGWNYINQDILGHQVITDYPQEIIDLIGTDIIKNGTISRQLLGQKVFSHPLLLNKLVNFSYPIIIQKTKSLLLDYHNVIEGAFFYKISQFFPGVSLWYIYIEEEVRRSLLQKRGHTEEYINAVYKNQKDILKHANLADVIIHNSSNEQELQKKVNSILSGE